MKRKNRLFVKALFLVISSLLVLPFFSFSHVSAAQETPTDITKLESNLLQFKAGNHILGFAPNKAYLASMDHALSVQFLGTRGVTPTADTNIPATGALTKAPSLSKVVYKDLWDGINLAYVATKDGITESTYHVAPGADVSQIKLRYNVPVEMRKDGSLEFAFDTGNVTESAPIAWQEINGKRQAVKVAFRIDQGEVGFSTGRYDKKYALVIDPTYQWHTFYGSANVDTAFSVTIDGSGNVYVTGASDTSWNGPTGQAPLHAFSGNNDIFVLKLNSSGAYQWHTFYGSASSEYAYGIAIDGNGNVYVTGYNYYYNWTGPEGQAPLHAHNGHLDYDAFVLKLNSSGAYQWHTFYGAISVDDYAYGIAIDGSGNVYVTGNSHVTWTGPTGQAPLNAFSNSGVVDNIFILKLSSSGVYQWHTFYGYRSDVYGIAMDGSDNVYVTGISQSWNGPIGQAPLNPNNGTNDIFILKLNKDGAYQWHTFYGATSGADNAKGIAIDGSGNVYVIGGSGAIWTGPAGQAPLNTLSGTSSIFVLKLNSSGEYQWHTFYGSSAYGEGIAIDNSGNAYVIGYSGATWNGPTDTLPLRAYSGHYDTFIVKLSSSGSYQWHTFYGSTSRDDFAYGIAIDGSNVYVTGSSSAAWNGDGDAPPLHTFSGAGGGSPDIFVLNLNDDSSTLYADFAGDGLNQWNGTTWTQLTNSHPASMVASGTSLYIDFAGDGFYKWNGSGFSLLTKDHPASMVASGTSLYAGFAGYGLYQWNGSTWTTLTNSNPASMVASGTSLYAGFAGYGLYQWNGSTWTTLTNSNPASMVASGTSLYAGFAGYGLYQWNGSTWITLTNSNPASMVASGTSLYADFAAYGLFEWNGSTWITLTNSHPASMVASDTSLYVDFAGDGLYQWSGSTWTKLTNSHPTGSMVASGTSLYVDFAGDGLYEWNGSTWTKLINNHPASMVAGF